MPEIIVITDTSCLIALTKTDALGLLRQLYHKVVITEEIRVEFGESLPEWIEIMTVGNKKYQRLIEGILDKGESSAIALAMELDNVLLVIDDLKARKEAKRLGLKITGTLGLLYTAKQKGFIPMLKPYLDKLQSVDFRISPVIIKELLTLSNEI
jgi:predicted nucleic acid-binding protein